MRECGLGHRYANHYRIKAESVDNDSRIRLVNYRLCVLGAIERMKVDALFLRKLARPQECGIGTPDLNPARVGRLTNIDRPTRRFHRPLGYTERSAHGLRRVPNAALVVSEVPPTPGTKVTLMWMNTEPISV